MPLKQGTETVLKFESKFRFVHFIKKMPLKQGTETPLLLLIFFVKIKKMPLKQGTETFTYAFTFILFHPYKKDAPKAGDGNGGVVFNILNF